MKKYLPLVLLMFPMVAFADSAPVAADPVVEWLNGVMALVSGFGGMAWYMKVSGIIMLVVGTMKIDAIKHLLWDKLGAAQTFVGPLLGLIAGALSTNNFSLGALAAYAFAGLGANYLYELLDLAKVPAAANSTVMLVLNILQSLIKKPQ